MLFILSWFAFLKKPIVIYYMRSLYTTNTKEYEDMSTNIKEKGYSLSIFYFTSHTVYKTDCIFNLLIAWKFILSAANPLTYSKGDWMEIFVMEILFYINFHYVIKNMFPWGKITVTHLGRNWWEMWWLTLWNTEQCTQKTLSRSY